MIKLVTILKEIQIGVDIEEVKKLIVKIAAFVEGGGQIVQNIIKPFINTKPGRQYNNYSSGMFPFLNSLDRQDLNKIYLELKKIKLDESFDKQQFFKDRARKKKSDQVASNFKFDKSYQPEKQEINVTYYQQLLNQSALSNSSRVYIQKVIDTIKKAGGLASQNQVVFLQKFKNGLLNETKNSLEESRISDIKSKLVPKFLDENEFNQIASIKVPKPIYIEWLIKVYIKEFKSQNKTIDDFMKTEPAQKIDYFEENKNLFSSKDITSYSYNSLNQEIIKMNKDIGPSSQALSNADLDKLNKVGFKNLGIIDGYQIIKIPKGTNSPQAWSAYKNLICQGRTQVCTASNYSRFEYYTTNDNFYLLVNAEDEAAPYHISNFTNVLKDKDDQDITDEKVLAIANKLK